MQYPVASTIAMPMVPDGAAKGGGANRHRVSETEARLTTDLDFARATGMDLDDFVDAYNDRLELGWAVGSTAQPKRPHRHPQLESTHQPLSHPSGNSSTDRRNDRGSEGTGVVNGSALSYSYCRYKEASVGRTSTLSTALRVEPAASERAPVADVARAVRSATDGVRLQLADGTSVPLPAALVEVLGATADGLADGHSVTVLSADVSLSPAEVAELLGLSRPFVVRLLDDGEIPSTRLPRSRHRRVRLADVIEFQVGRERRRAGRQRIAAIIDDADLPY